jgi:excisionase family DNA binding protein
MKLWAMAEVATFASRSTPTATWARTSIVGATRFEPATILLPKRDPSAAGDDSDSPSSWNIEGTGERKAHPSQPFADSRRSFAPSVLPAVLDSGGGAGATRPVPGTEGALLSVREVAEQLRVCTATVYQLCDQGRLRHVRIMNALRVSPGDLAAFPSQRRRLRRP